MKSTKCPQKQFKAMYCIIMPPLLSPCITVVRTEIYKGLCDSPWICLSEASMTHCQITCAFCEHALICKEDSGESHSSCILLVYEQRSTSGPHGNLMDSVSDSLVWQDSMSYPGEAGLPVQPEWAAGAI